MNKTKFVTCIESFDLPKIDEEGRQIENEYFTVENNSIWLVDKESYRFVGADVRLFNKNEWLEINKATLWTYFRPLKVNV